MLHFTQNNNKWSEEKVIDAYTIKQLPTLS